MLADIFSSSAKTCAECLHYDVLREGLDEKSSMALLNRRLVRKLVAGDFANITCNVGDVLDGTVVVLQDHLSYTVYVRISEGYHDQLPRDEHSKGAKLCGKVVGVQEDLGLFVEFAAGCIGLLHIAKLSAPAKLANYSTSQEFDVDLLKIDIAKQRSVLDISH